MIHIVYEPLLAGKLIATIITAFTENNSSQLEKFNDNSKRWTQREGDFNIDKNIEFVKGHHFQFKHFLNYENLIFLSCNTEKEKELLESRVAHVKHGIMNNPRLIDIRIKYLIELLSFLKANKKELFEIPFSHVWDTTKFTKTMGDCLKWLNIPYDEEKIKYAQKLWIRSNIVRKNKLTEEERRWWT